MKNKLEIFEARGQGYTYASIARALNMNPDAVRVLCKRNGIEPVEAKKHKQDCELLHVCRFCGRLIVNSPKEFCNRACKDIYRNEQKRLAKEIDEPVYSDGWYSFKVPCFNKSQTTLQEGLDSSIDWSVNPDETILCEGGLTNGR